MTILIIQIIPFSEEEKKAQVVENPDSQNMKIIPHPSVASKQVRISTLNMAI